MMRAKLLSTVKPRRNFFRIETGRLDSGFSTGTTRTHTNVPLGKPSPDRYVFVFISSQSSLASSISGVTLNGAAMTVGRTETDNGYTTVGVYFIAEANSPTGTVEVTLTGAGNKNADIVIGTFYTGSLSVAGSASSGAFTSTGALSLTSTTAGKLSLWCVNLQAFSPSSSMAMTIQDGISVLYNPVITQGNWIACVQPDDAAGGTVTFTPNWTPDTGFSDGISVAIRFTHS